MLSYPYHQVGLLNDVMKYTKGDFSMKRISALFLVFAMLFAIIPFAALAEEAAPTIDEALNVENGTLKFTAKDWEVVCEEPDDVTESDSEEPAGRVYVRSTNHDGDSSSQIKLVADVNAGDILTFDAKASSEEGYDGLVVAVDGETIASVTGEYDWDSYYYIFDDEGTYVITWKYIKDDSYDEGEDCAYVDNVYLGENTFELEDINITSSITLVPGFAAVIDVVPVPKFAPMGTVTFESSNEEVATVDEQGVVTAVAVGDAVITVKEETLEAKEVTVSVVEPKTAHAFLIYDEAAEEEENAVYGLYEVEMHTGLKKAKLAFEDFLQTYMMDTIFGPMEAVENVNAAEYLDGYVYMFTDTGRFVVIDAETYEVVTEVGNLETGEDLQMEYSVTDMAFDYDTYTMYGLAWDNAGGETPYLVSIDTETGDVTEISQFDFSAYELAADKGVLYTVAGDGMLYSVTPAGEATSVGYLDIAPSYLQTMGFDHETNELYWLGIGTYADDLDGEYMAFVATVDVEQGEMNYTILDSLMEFTGLYFECEDTTEKIPVTGVELDKTEIELKWRETATLTATVLPENATKKTVRWTSSDEAVATVKNGVVTAVGAGEAVITVTTVDGGFTAECKVTVTGAPKFILNESFEPAKDDETGYEVEGWRMIDADGDGNNWEAYAMDGIEAYDGVGVMVSQSYINDIGPLTPDNWLISPAFKVEKEETFASWYVTAQDPSYSAENYAVYVVPEGTADEDLKDCIKIYDGTATGAWVNQTAQIPADFVGQEVRLAFRHYNTTDMYWIKLDLVQVYTIEEAVQPEMVTVTFVDGVTKETIATVEVEKGKDVEFPEVPEHEGYFFAGWDNEGKEIAEDITITALYTLYGDCDGDGVVNTKDAVVILKYAAEMMTLEENGLIAANVNFDKNDDGSEKVNTADAVLVLKFAADMIPGFEKPVEE